MADVRPALRVTVSWSPAPRVVREWVLDLPAGATAGQALAASGLYDECPECRAQPPRLAVWGRLASAAHVLREGDRLEVLRALRVDPKVARRERFRKQGTRSAGLFARKKPGAR